MLTSSCKSYLSNWHPYITKSITLSPPSLALSLKILPISRSSTRGVVSSTLICCHPSLMPLLLASIYYAVLITFILSISEIMPSCSCCVEKGLVYIAITALSGCQPLSYAKYIKANICLSCNVYSVSNTKYMCYSTLFNHLVFYLNCYKVLDLICC